MSVVLLQGHGVLLIRYDSSDSIHEAAQR
jgi:hypothetical protein